MYINKHIVENCDVFVIFDFPSVSEAESGYILSGNAKQYVYNALRSQGIAANAVSYYSVLSHPLGNQPIKSLYRTTKKDIQLPDTKKYGEVFFGPAMSYAIDALFSAIDDARPRLIICMSVLALNAFGFEGSLDAWRGSQLKWRQYRLLPMYSPLMMYKKLELKLPFNRDMARAKSSLQDDNYQWDMPTFNMHVCLEEEQALYWLNAVLLRVHVPTVRMHEDGSIVIKSDKGSKRKLAVDIETRLGFITFISMAWSARDVLVIPFIDKDGKSYWSSEAEFKIVKAIQKILVHENLALVGQNFQYDAQYIAKLWGVLPHITQDTMCEAHVLFTKGQPLDLAFLASLYCEWYRYWKDDKGLHKSFDSMDDFMRYTRYSGYDSCYTYEIGDAMDKIHGKVGDPDVIAFQRDMVNIVLKPVLKGIKFDKKQQMMWRDGYAKTIKSYQAWLLWMIPQANVNATGESLWFDSPTQLSFLFYKQLGVEPVISRKTKAPTTDDDALLEIGKREPLLRLVCDVLRAYRSLNQFYNLYLMAKESDDGRMRTQYKLAGTDTFRLASSKDAFDNGMNLQNLSKG